MLETLNDGFYSNMSGNILKKGLDYNEINISSEQVAVFFEGFVVNSPFRFKEHYSFTLISDEGSPKNISVAYKDVKIASLFHNKFNSGKNGYYLTLYGTYYNFDYADILCITDLFDIVGYPYNYQEYNLYRFDYCLDIANLEVDSIYYSLDLDKINIKNIPNREDSHTKKKTWFIVDFEDYSIRVYNKKLDIEDKGLNSKSKRYQAYLDTDYYITRIEVVIKRRLIKKYKFKRYSEIELFGQNKLMKFINTYLYTNFPIFTQELELNVNNTDINIKKQLEFNKTMFLSYYKKLQDTSQGVKYLKGKFLIELNDNYDVFK